MKSEFYQQLQQLAREILENPSPDIESLQQTSRQLYEKLTIVRYTEEIMEQFAELSANNTEQEEQTIQSLEETVEPQHEDVEEFIEEPSQDLPEDWSDQDVEQEQVIDVFEQIEEKCVCHDPEPDEIPQDNASDEPCEFETEQTSPQDNDFSQVKKDIKKPEAAQVSMFDFDLFDDKEIGYDPEEDLFEAKSQQDDFIDEPNVEIRTETFEVDALEERSPSDDYTPISFSGFEVLDDDADQEDQEIVEGEVEQQNTKPTVNDILAEEKHSPSLNERFAAHNNINIGLNDRIAFTTHLFDGDTEAFTASVSYLSSVNDFGVAHEYITEILKPAYKNWTDKHMYEKRFMDIIMASFAAK